MQWNPSNPDTNGTKESGRNIEVSFCSGVKLSHDARKNCY